MNKFYYIFSYIYNPIVILLILNEFYLTPSYKSSDTGLSIVFIPFLFICSVSMIVLPKLYKFSVTLASEENKLFNGLTDKEIKQKINREYLINFNLFYAVVFMFITVYLLWDVYDFYGNRWERINEKIFVASLWLSLVYYFFKMIFYARLYRK